MSTVVLSVPDLREDQLDRDMVSATDDLNCSQALICTQPTISSKYSITNISSETAIFGIYICFVFLFLGEANHRKYAET